MMFLQQWVFYSLNCLGFGVQGVVSGTGYMCIKLILYGMHSAKVP